MRNYLSSIFIVGSMAFSLSAMASFELANNGKKVTCFADDSQSWVLNASRKTLKYTVEGESLGAEKIIKTETDGKTFVSYKTKSGTLYLDDNGDAYLFEGESTRGTIACK